MCHSAVARLRFKFVDATSYAVSVDTVCRTVPRRLRFESGLPQSPRQMSAEYDFLLLQYVQSTQKKKFSGKEFSEKDHDDFDGTRYHC